MIVKWILINLLTHAPSVYNSTEQASQEAIRRNKEEGGNPSFALWEYNGKATKLVGFLWRDGNAEYDPFNCWKQ